MRSYTEGARGYTESTESNPSHLVYLNLIRLHTHAHALASLASVRLAPGPLCNLP